MRLLARAARILARLFPSLRRVDLVGQIDGLCSQLTAELDFESELRNAGDLGDALAGSGITIPECVEDLCTPRVLVMEFLAGSTVSASGADVAALGLGTDVARQILRALLWPLVRRGVFHADMHGGNILLGSGARVSLVDFGSLCSVDEDTRTKLVNTLLCLFDRKFEEAAFNMLGLVDVAQADLVGAQPALAVIASDSLDRGIEDVALGLVAKQILDVGSTFGIVMPVALTALLRQMVLLDGSIRQLDGGFNIFDEGGVILRAALTSAETEGEATKCQPLAAGITPALLAA